MKLLSSGRPWHLLPPTTPSICSSWESSTVSSATMPRRVSTSSAHWSWSRTTSRRDGISRSQTPPANNLLKAAGALMKKKRVPSSEQTARKDAPVSAPAERRIPLWIPIVVIALATVIAYLPLFDAEKQFTNYDDNGYVTGQPLVLEFRLEEMFKTTSAVGLNYHPLTVLSLALSHKMFGLDARAFGLTNLLFHVVNSLLVFWFIYRLTNKSTVVAGLAGLWFGIHPMHVESVAWIAERKDVLYAFFFLLAMIAYQKYLNSSSYLHLALVFASFVASCLSKAMAVPLPFVLLLLDYWHGRKWTASVVLEKLPFIAVAVWIGMLTVNIQTDLGAVSAYASMSKRLIFASYSYVMYLVSMLAPFNLSPFHPYPGTGADSSIPGHFMVMPLVAIALVAMPWIAFRSNPQWRKLWIVGLGFYTLLVALVLQVVSVGLVLMADRYTYVSYIGSLLLLASAAGTLLKGRGRAVGIVLTSAFSIMLMVGTFNQSKVWKDAPTLWSSVIASGSKNPDKVAATRENILNGYTPVYVFSATYHIENQQFDKAYEDLSFLFIAECVNPAPYEQLGLVCGILGKYEESVKMFSKAISMHKVAPPTYLNRGISYMNLGRREEAFGDFEACLAAGATGQDFVNASLYVLDELTRKGRYAECIERAKALTERVPDNHEGYFFAGTALLNLGRYAEAETALRKSLELKPDQPGVKQNLSVALARMRR
ncbi:MAG: tetratricopeptide repeat protein [Candidatus Kapabacteria bacterium]|nr:tetratricopeptide repeat protein [Candidatus Kapabacteria bacterium]